MTHEHDSDPEDDAALFRAAVGKITPVPDVRVTPTAPRPKPIPRHRLADEQAVLRASLGAAAIEAEVQPGDMLEFHREGVPRSILTKLRRGRFRIEAEIDLHGMTADEAENELAAFLADARRHAHRCVRVIHGKGLRSGNAGPVLKGRLAYWLGRRDDVLAYVSARPADGGTGAVYVLLRNPP